MNVTGKKSPLQDLSKESLWHTSAPPVVRRAFRAGNDSEGWAAWQEHLRQRTDPLPLRELLPDREFPLLWALPDGLAGGDLSALLGLLARVAAGRRVDPSWLAAACVEWTKPDTNGQLTAGLALESLAWCHALPRLAERLERDEWLGLLRRLVALARQAQSLALDEDPLAHQLLAGELGLTLACLFPEIKACRLLARPSRALLSAGLGNLLDRQGLPHGKHLRLVRPLLACWTRSRTLGSVLPDGCWNRAAEKRYPRFVRQVMRLMRPDGTQVFGPCNDAKAVGMEKGLLDAVLGLVGDDERELAAQVLPGSKRPARPARRLALPEAAAHSEWASIAVLRRGWERNDPRLVVHYHGPSVEVEFDCGPEVFWVGPWELELRQDGERLEPVSPWEEICWFSDEQMDYVELEARFRGGVRVQRHLALAHEDDFLLMADSVLGPRPATWEYRSRLPLAAGVTFAPAEENHEGFLRGPKRRALALPLALAEWRCDPRPGALTAVNQGLELFQTAKGAAMFAPLLVDFDPRRIRQPYTWRRLTVAENLQALPDDVAVGYRVMVGRQQWLLYRSLAAAGNRSVLGHNLISQMLVARFDQEGEVESLVEIE